MSNINDGGPAFPREDYQRDDAHGQRGMSLRDYFAAKVMQGICAHQDTWGLSDEQICRRAYVMADEMIKVRES